MGNVKKEAPVRGMEFGVRLEMGRIQDVRKAETDLLR